MSAPGNGREPSMEEILASIRNMVSQDPSLRDVGTAAPELPNPMPTSQGTAGELNGSAPAQNMQTHQGPSFGAPAQIGQHQTPGRQDDDDLADLLDEPLSPADPLRAPGSFAGEAQAGPGPVNGSVGNPANSGPASLGFDFGSLVPRRDPEPSSGSGLPMPGPSRPGDAPRQNDFAAPAPAHTKGPNDTPSFSWPESMRSNPTVPHDAPSSKFSPPPSGPQSDAATPQAGGNANGFAGPSFEKTAGPHADGRAVDGPENPGRFFPGPQTGKPLPDRPEGDFAQTSRPEEKSSSPSVAPQSKPSTPAAKDEGVSSFPSFFNSRPATPSKDAQSDNKSSSSVPSIEPVLRAFEKIDSKGADTGAAQADTKKAPQVDKVVSAPPKPATSPINLGAPLVSVPGKETAAKTAAPEGRTPLEDAVMDLLRPMLREWLDDNLPQIIEDAVRREVSSAVKAKADPGSKA